MGDPDNIVVIGISRTNLENDMRNRTFADLSNNNVNEVNFEAYRKAGHILVGLKATEGTGFIDKRHAEWSERAHKGGVHVIHYHYARLGESVSNQVVLFGGVVQRHFGPHDFYCIDLERGENEKFTPAEMAAFLNDFDKQFRQKIYHTLRGYMNESLLKEVTAEKGRIAGNNWWIAAWGNRPPVVLGIKRWAWQRSNGVVGPEPHTLVGIGQCDVSTMNWGTFGRLVRNR